MIEELKEMGLNLTEQERVAKKSQITDKVFIFTGELESFSRIQAQKLVEELGGRWASSISKDIDFVIVGKNPGSKYDKAINLGLKILNEGEFKNLLKH
jgi:DNA ligase (NAD+)